MIMAKRRNFSAFHAIMRLIPYDGDKEELKDYMVYNVTNGRTQSLREVSREEYSLLCKSIERGLPYDPEREARLQELRRYRDIVRGILRDIGLDVTQDNEVDGYLKSPTLAGKALRFVKLEEFEKLIKQLRMILHKQNKKQ